MKFWHKVLATLIVLGCRGAVPDGMIDDKVLFYDTDTSIFDYIAPKAFKPTSGYANIDFIYLIKMFDRKDISTC